MPVVLPPVPGVVPPPLPPLPVLEPPPWPSVIRRESSSSPHAVVSAAHATVKSP
jgi:hypothetical protein